MPFRKVTGLNPLLLLLLAVSPWAFLHAAGATINHFDPGRMHPIRYAILFAIVVNLCFGWMCWIPLVMHIVDRLKLHWAVGVVMGGLWLLMLAWPTAMLTFGLAYWLEPRTP